MQFVSDVIFLVWEDQASVLIWISCMNPCIPPLRPSQTFVRRPLINLERLLPYPLISFHFIWMTENEAFQVLLFGKIRLWLSVSFLRFQHVKFHESRDLWFLLLEWKFFSAFSFFPFLLKKKKMWLAFQPRKHEGTWCPFSYGTSLGLSQFTIGLNFVSKPDGGSSDTIS